MAINVADNFSYKGSKPLDARIKANTVSALVSTPAADLYDGCFAYVTETKKYYSYDSTNTSDPTLGKWREFQQGGGGGSTYTAGDGIDITNDVISTVKSEVGDMDEIIDELPSGGRVMVTGFTPIGTIISVFSESAPQHYLICDGSTYNKSDYPELAEHLLSLTTHSQYEVSGDDTKFKVPDLRGEFLRGTGTNSHTNQGSGVNVGVHQDATQHLGININSDKTINANRNTSDAAYSEVNSDSSITVTSPGTVYANGKWDNSSNRHIYYTSRPTNTSVLYCIATKNIYTNPMNDYSTSEKVVGTWINGKPIYQKTINGTIPTLSEDFGNPVIENIDATALNIDECLSIQVNGSSSSLSLGFYGAWTTRNNTTGGVGLTAAFYDPANSRIRITNNRAGYSGTSVKLTIQYTKTTD